MKDFSAENHEFVTSRYPYRGENETFYGQLMQSQRVDHEILFRKKNEYKLFSVKKHIASIYGNYV